MTKEEKLDNLAAYVANCEELLGQPIPQALFSKWIKMLEIDITPDPRDADIYKKVLDSVREFAPKLADSLKKVWGLEDLEKSE